MAAELIQLPNPDNKPGAVSSGYQRQNNNIFALQTGLDTCEPYEDGNIVVVPQGGVIEINGVMFKISRQVELPITMPVYWIAVKDTGASNAAGERVAAASLSARPGAWDPVKRGCYLPDGSRTLSLTPCFLNNAAAQITPAPAALVRRVNEPGSGGEFLRKGWHFIILKSGIGGADASGHNGGIAANGTQEEIRRFIFIAEPGRYGFYVGRGGADGGNSSNAGGGGSGGGEASVFNGSTPGWSYRAYAIGGNNAASGGIFNSGDVPGGRGTSGNPPNGYTGSVGASSHTMHQDIITATHPGASGAGLSEGANAGLCEIYKFE